MPENKTEFNDWCPGCGDFGILRSVESVLSDMKLDYTDAVVVSGIGCSGKAPHFISGPISGVHTLHGRALAFATGIKLANPNMKVIVEAGDGDTFGIGVGHFVSSGRRNLSITVIVHDNGVYGLTKGQASPTLAYNEQTKSLPKPNINNPINPTVLALASGYSFVARSFAYNVALTNQIMKKAIAHKGAAFIDILQPCPTYNNINTNEWYRSRVYTPQIDYLVEDPSEKSKKMFAAMELSEQANDKIALGILYQNELDSPFEERIAQSIVNYNQRPPSQQEIDEKGSPITDIGDLISKARVV